MSRRTKTVTVIDYEKLLVSQDEKDAFDRSLREHRRPRKVIERNIYFIVAVVVIAGTILWHDFHHTGTSSSKTELTKAPSGYVAAASVSVVGTTTLDVDGIDYLTPYPLSDYPPNSVVVFGANKAAPYLWTGTTLVLLAPPCVIPGVC